MWIYRVFWFGIWVYYVCKLGIFECECWLYDYLWVIEMIMWCGGEEGKDVRFFCFVGLIIDVD